MLSSEDASEGTPFLLFRDMQIGSGTADIQIILPIDFHLFGDEERCMRTLINRHKLASGREPSEYLPLLSNRPTEIRATSQRLNWYVSVLTSTETSYISLWLTSEQVNTDQ
jgi:hypothetical protein